MQSTCDNVEVKNTVGAKKSVRTCEMNTGRNINTEYSERVGAEEDHDCHFMTISVKTDLRERRGQKSSKSAWA